MRTFDEIRADINTANRNNDIESLRVLAQEMRALGTPQSEASALIALGAVDKYVGDYASAMEQYRQALMLLEELEDRHGVAGVLGSIGVIFARTNDPRSAIDYQQRALDIFEEIGDRMGVAHSNLGIANAQANIDNLTLALEQYRKALDIYSEEGYLHGVANVSGNIGTVYKARGDYATALEHYRRALDQHLACGSIDGVASVSSNIATLYLEIGDYPAALDYYRRALSIYEERVNTPGVALVTSNIGNVFLEIGDVVSTLEYLHRALAMFEQLGDQSGTARVTSNLGNASYQSGDHASALECYRRALDWYKSVGDPYGALLVQSNLIKVLLDLEMYDDASEALLEQSTMVMEDARLRGMYEANLAQCAEHANDLAVARDHLTKALEIVSKAGLRPETAYFHRRLRDLAQTRNDFADYIEHNNEHNRITEEIRGREAMQKISMIDAERKMEAERRERDKERALLYGALPESVATRMLRGEDVTGDHYDNAAVLFLDIVGFTAISEQLHPGQVVQFLEHVFSSLDEICKKHELTKIKTIGDSYMAVSFPSRSSSSEQQTASVAVRAALASLDMLDAVSKIMIPNGSPEGSPERSHVSVRIGMHCGAR